MENFAWKVARVLDGGAEKLATREASARLARGWREANARRAREARAVEPAGAKLKSHAMAAPRLPSGGRGYISRRGDRAEAGPGQM